MTKETDSRIIIDRKLSVAGWDIADKTQVATEETARTVALTIFCSTIVGVRSR